MQSIKMKLGIPRDLLEDINLVTNLLQIGKEHLLEGLIRKEISSEKERLMRELGTLYSQGKITKNDLFDLAGKETAEEMDFIKTKTEQSYKGALKLNAKNRK